MISKTELAYMAGFFDGEGCISIAKCAPRYPGCSPYYRVVVAMTLTNETVLRLFHARFGGVFHLMHGGKAGKSKPWRPQWQWHLEASDSIVFLGAILPYLKLKHDEAELALRILTERKQNRSPKRKTPLELSDLEQKKVSLRVLKDRTRLSPNGAKHDPAGLTSLTEEPASSPTQDT